MAKKFPFYQQLDAMDCGATCLRMVAKYHGRHYSLEHLRELTFMDREGVSILGIADAAEAIGMHTLAVKLDYEKLLEEVELPVIVHWRQKHFIVVHHISNKHVWIADPGAGKFSLTKDQFLAGWLSDKVDEKNVGVALIVEPTPDFFKREGDEPSKSSLGYLWPYIKQYKGLLFQLSLGLLIGSLIQLFFPFMMQAVVDIGITNQNINFIVLILIAQLVLFFSQSIVEVIRSWILLHIGIRVNISLVSEFLAKLMRMPIRFFDTKMTGDLLQRIYDNNRVEKFLTSAALFTLFSFFTFVVFGIVLLFYSRTIFGIFLIGTILYVIWVSLFLRKRKELDYKRFDQLAENQSTLIQLVSGMQEIKLHNAEKQKRWNWERIQARLFRVSMSYLALDQWQRRGASFINESKNIIITFIAAKAVIDGQMTLGMMLAIQYIIGQLNSPLDQLIEFVTSSQDARISIERMNEIHNVQHKENILEKINVIEDEADLVLNKVSFRYGGPHSTEVLRNINLTIPYGKTTAIVGTSGSGKTTLLKLLLKFYAPTEGSISVDDININRIDERLWREKCSVVMQDGYIFSESIANNIAFGVEHIDKKRMLKAARAANIKSFIETLPLGFNTKIGQDGVGLSQGQAQRLLIARAIYKDPDYFFFDEATNSLDAFNEMVILDNLEEIMKGKTVVVVAHRLSTVKNADNIVVLERGEILEQGTHKELVEMQGAYYHLIKNQLELGN